MDYTDNEKQLLSLLRRTDFKNLSKNDFIGYASKLSKLRPEVAKDVIAQFPELAKLIQSSMVEYKDILEKIVASDDESTNQVYAILNKEIDVAGESRKEYIELADKVLSDLSKCLDYPDLTPTQQRKSETKRWKFCEWWIRRIQKYGNKKQMLLEWQIKRIWKRKNSTGR